MITSDNFYFSGTLKANMGWRSGRTSINELRRISRLVKIER